MFNTLKNVSILQQYNKTKTKQAVCASLNIVKCWFSQFWHTKNPHGYLPLGCRFLIPTLHKKGVNTALRQWNRQRKHVRPAGSPAPLLPFTSKGHSNLRQGGEASTTMVAVWPARAPCHQPKEEKEAEKAKHGLRLHYRRPWSTPHSPSSPPSGGHGGNLGDSIC